MRMLLHLSLLAFGAASACAAAVLSPMQRLVAETMALLSTHQALLIGDEVTFLPECCSLQKAPEITGVAYA